MSAVKDAEDMPARKRRRIMEGPDGFTRSVGTPKASKVPQFAPAFEGQEQPAFKPVPTTSKTPPVPRTEKVITRPRYSLPPTAMERPVSNSKPLSVSKPTSAVTASKVAPKTVSLSKPVSKANLRQLEVRTGTLVKPDKLNLLPLKPPFSLVESSVKASTIAPLQRLPPPPAVQPSETPSKLNHTLQSLGPPPMPSKHVTTPGKSMRTISTTHIALANDLSTESGKAELASIFLHDQHPEILAHTKNDEDGNWNLGVSPQKMGRSSKGKGKEPKFVRGGLAARASTLFSQTHTALALWQKEIDNVLSSSSSTARRLTPDLRLRIVKIVDVPAGSGSRRPGTSTTSPGLAVCRVQSTSSYHKHTTRSLPGEKGGQNHLVVLSFPTTAPPRTNLLHVRNPEDFVEGREVYVWEPWQEVALSSPTPMTEASSNVGDAEFFGITPAPFPLLPSSIPFSPSPTQIKEEDISDIPLADTALLCSRFLIMR